MFRHPHQHRYQPAAVDHRRTPITGTTTTLVLWRCPCAGGAYSTTLDGNWSLAQLRGEDDRGAFVPPKPVPEPPEPLPAWERDLLEKQAEARSEIQFGPPLPADTAGPRRYSPDADDPLQLKATRP
jgi:hypothetical protein